MNELNIIILLWVCDYFLVSKEFICRNEDEYLIDIL